MVGNAETGLKQRADFVIEILNNFKNLKTLIIYGKMKNRIIYYLNMDKIIRKYKSQQIRKDFVVSKENIINIFDLRFF
jgi:hypothetical protein